MAKEHSGPTMADVAREAGVALGTVSRVVNGEQVGDEFKEKVNAAIQRLGYQYNISGRALRTDRTNTVAFMIPNTFNPYFALLAHHINVALEKRKYKMLLCFSGYDQNRETEIIQMAQQNRVDGIIALTYNPNLSIPEDIPFVTIDRFFSVSVPCVASDNFGGGYLAAHKLKEFGCKKVAFLRFGSTLTNEPSKRKDGFVAACVEMGLPFEVMALEDGQPFSEFEKFLSSHLHSGRLDFDGLFIGTDSLAWLIIQELKKMGLDVYMLSGDNPERAGKVASKVGIDKVISGVLPDSKHEHIKELRAQGRKVAMVGDGINDSPALALADLSVAMGNGTDIAMNASMATIVNSDLRSVPELIKMSRKTSKIIKENLFWAFFYNVLAVPIAAGILYPINGFLLNPMIAAACMALSSICVVTNSLRLKR